MLLAVILIGAFSSQPPLIANSIPTTKIVRGFSTDFICRELFDSISEDKFDIIYTPVDTKQSDVSLATIYIIEMKKWDASFKDIPDMGGFDYVSKKNTFIVIGVKHQSNPFPARSADEKNFNALTDSYELLFNRIGFEEAVTSENPVYGEEYGFSLDYSKFGNIFVTRKPADSSVGTCDFMSVYYINADKSLMKLSDLYAFSAKDWRTASALPRFKNIEPLFNCLGLVIVSLDDADALLKIPNFSSTQVAAYSEKLASVVSSANVFDHAAIGTAIPGNLITFKLNTGGRTLQNFVFLDNSRHPLFPLRDICEALGYTVSWSERTHSFTITRDQELLISRRVDLFYSIDSFAKTDNISCCIIGQRTYVDTDFLINILDLSIGYDGGDTITVAPSK